MRNVEHCAPTLASGLLIAEYLRADSFHIKVATPYPKNYKKCTEIALAEQKKKARPALAEQMSNLKKYDIVFLGYPIWWGDLPMTVYTFLENGDFSGKIIIPFCTHEGSGASNTKKSIETACPKAKVLKTFAMKGQTAQKLPEAAKKEILRWIEGIKLQ